MKRKKNISQKNRWFLILSFLFMASLIQHLTPANNTFAATKTAYSKVDELNMRKKASSSSKILKEFNEGDDFKVTGSKGNWYKVTSDKKKGYVYKKYVTFTNPLTEKVSTSAAENTDPSNKEETNKSEKKTAKGEEIVKYAKKFVGNPYRYGGTSLTKGADCSGFTQSIYKKFGVKLPRTSSQQRSAGKKVSSLKKAKAGDLICYYGHVAIYMGNNKIVHASSRKTGIKISYNASYRKIASIRRIV